MNTNETMDTKELLKNLDGAYKDIQVLDLKPTKINMTVLLSVMAVLEQTYKYLAAEADKAEETVAEPED